MLLTRMSLLCVLLSLPAYAAPQRDAAIPAEATSLSEEVATLGLLVQRLGTSVGGQYVLTLRDTRAEESVTLSWMPAPRALTLVSKGFDHVVTLKTHERFAVIETFVDKGADGSVDLYSETWEHPRKKHVRQLKKRAVAQLVYERMVRTAVGFLRSHLRNSEG